MIIFIAIMFFLPMLFIAKVGWEATAWLWAGAFLLSLVIKLFSMVT